MAVLSLMVARPEARIKVESDEYTYAPYWSGVTICCGRDPVLTRSTHRAVRNAGWIEQEDKKVYPAAVKKYDLLTGKESVFDRTVITYRLTDAGRAAVTKAKETAK